MSFAKEVVKRVTLHDLVQDNDAVLEMIDHYELDHKRSRKIGYTARNASRALFRLNGDIWAGMSTYVAFYNTDHIPQLALSAITGLALGYGLDYLFYDKLFPSPAKKTADK